MASHYPNPYDFVPFEGAPTRCVDWRAHGLPAAGLTGKIKCKLTVLSPVFVGAVQPKEIASQVQYVPARDGDTPILPATAIKGMVRSVVEAASNSCLGVLSNEYAGIGPVTPAMARQYQSCNRLDQLCPVCALFGMTEEKTEEQTKEQTEKGTSNDKGKALAGRVIFSDAKPAADKLPPPTALALPARSDTRGVVVPLGGPKPSHKPFYFDAQGQLLGRKFYFRSRKWKEILQRNTQIYQAALAKSNKFRTIGVSAISENAVFCFDVHFTNLSSTELDLLIYGLQMEEGTCHHIGYAKPFGLGSVKVEIQTVLTQKIAEDAAGPARYLKYEPDSEECWQPIDYSDYATRVWQRDAPAQVARQQLLHILKWPREDIFLYPERFKFFKTSDGNQPLGQYQAEAKWVQNTTSSSEAGDDIRAQLRRRLGIDS